MSLFDIDPSQALPIPPLEAIGTQIIAPVQEGPPDIIPGLLPRKGQLVLAGDTNVGKAMSLDTPIPTPLGWRTMQDIQAGDQVYGSTGLPINVLATSPIFQNRKCYKVTFRDGSSCVVDAAHQWTVRKTTRHPPKAPITVTTQEMVDIGVTYNNEYLWQIIKAPELLNIIEQTRHLTSQNYHTIESIKPVDSVPVKCLVVDADDHLFLAGRNCVPTHNSLVALEITSSLVTGNNLWNELTPTVQSKKVLYILGEHYNEVIQRLWQHTKLPMTDQVWLLGPEQLGYDKWLVAQGKPNPMAIAKLTKWAEGADLIIFDPLAAFVTGIDAENDNVQMRLVLDTMSLIAQQVGASCIVLAHQGKPMIDRDGKEHTKKSYAIRGASAIEDAATNIFYMNRADGTSAVAAETKEHKIFTIKCRKYKGNAPEEYKLMRDPSNLTHTLLGNRPFTEVRSMETQAMVSRLQLNFPDLKMTEIVKIVATAERCSEATVWNRLKGK